ncbi:MAG: glycosyltransferase family 2 protein [Anaerolineae bacterium]
MSGVLIIVPAYNEEESLPRVISAVRQSVPHAEIAVINDGSTAATARVAAECSVVVLNQPYNLGIGSTMQTGYMYAMQQGFSVAVQVDGDGQHNAEEIPVLLEALTEPDVDVVIGSRFMHEDGYRPPAMRRLGIVILSGILSLATGQRITDPTSGFRAVNKRTIAFYAQDYPFDYPEPEAIILLHRAGLRIREVPVRMSERLGGQSSITPMRSAYYMIKVVLAILINLLRHRPEV